MHRFRLIPNTDVGTLVKSRIIIKNNKSYVKLFVDKEGHSFSN